MWLLEINLPAPPHAPIATPPNPHHRNKRQWAPHHFTLMTP
jgi:hypothetical protein